MFSLGAMYFPPGTFWNLWDPRVATSNLAFLSVPLAFSR